MRKIDQRLLRRFDRYLVGQRRLADSTRRLRHQDLATFIRWVDAADEDPLAMGRPMFGRYSVHLVTEAPEIRIQPPPWGWAAPPPSASSAPSAPSTTSWCRRAGSRPPPSLRPGPGR